jgi:hypothetical protein
LVDRRRSFLKFYLLLKQVCSELHVRDSLFSFAAASSSEIWSRAETLAISEEVSALINTSNVTIKKVNGNHIENGNFHCCPDASVV